MKTLTTTEASRLGELESVIRIGQSKFVEVGNALAEIRDKKLYRSFYSNFEQYCLAVWGWSRQRGYQMIQAAEVVGELPPTFALEVGNERDARALAGLTPEDQKEIISEAKKSGVSIAEKASHFCEKPDSIDRTLSTTVDTLGKEPPKKVIDHRLDYDPDEQPEESIKRPTNQKEYDRLYERSLAVHKANEDLNARVIELESILSDYEEMSKVISSDDRLKAYRDECRNLREIAQKLQERMNGLQGEVNMAIKLKKAAQKKLEAYEKAAVK